MHVINQGVVFICAAFLLLTDIVICVSSPAMTAYSPAMLALHDLLRSQLELTREFLEMQKRVHAEADANIQPRYCYTTLEDTKKVWHDFSNLISMLTDFDRLNLPSWKDGLFKSNFGLVRVPSL